MQQNYRISIVIDAQIFLNFLFILYIAPQKYTQHHNIANESCHKQDYGHKDSEELDKVLVEVSPNDLSKDEKAYLDRHNQYCNHTLNIQFNDTNKQHLPV